MMRLDQKNWTIAEYPGYFGKKSNEMEQLYDTNYGSENWKIAYVWCEKIVSRDFALQIYEDAYHAYFQNNPDVLEWLLHTASDVYDNAVSNIHSYLDYHIQEEQATHLQDIAIRRIVFRFGRAFKGKRLLQIRGNNSPGYILNPGEIPFHLPERIEVNANCPRWAKPDSVEAFWQCNKIIIVKKDN